MPPIVETRHGRVEGLRRDEGILEFRGIPYAAPPVGERRFRPPAAPEPWDGVRPATEWAAVAAQNASMVERIFGGRPTRWSEDSLVLNVWTPAVDDASRPVMVWIHGGAFTTGSGAVPWYHGDTFARDGVVLVTINYRLGPFGFLHLAGLGGEGFAGAGNAGLLDQVAALRWVRDNVAAFGGDPANVTVFGESAGAMSIGALLGVPAARGLFTRAIMQSGATANVHCRDDADANAAELLSIAGIGVDDVRDVPGERLLEAAGELERRRIGKALAFQPVVDGAVLPRPPIDAVRDGEAADITLVVGTTADEWRLFSFIDPRMQGMDDVRLQAHAAALFGDHDRAVRGIEIYRRERPSAFAADVFGAIVTDCIFRIPAIRLAEAQTAAGGTAHAYLFSWASTAFGGMLGSCHALDVPFAFDHLASPGVDVFTGGSAPQSLADAMHGAWVRFATTGAPGWPAYDVDRRPTMRLDATSSVVDDPHGAERAAWDGIG